MIRRLGDVVELTITIPVVAELAMQKVLRRPDEWRRIQDPARVLPLLSSRSTWLSKSTRTYQGRIYNPDRL